MTDAIPGTKTYAGGCHCGAVRYEVELDLSKPIGRCNCSICTKLASTGTSVKPAAFRLVGGEDALSRYAFGPAAARFFCRHCGIHVYGAGDIAELGGAFASVNCNTLDDVDPNHDLKIGYWDGRHDNWMAGMRDTPWPIRA